MSRSEYRYREHAYTCALSIHCVGMKCGRVVPHTRDAYIYIKRFLSFINFFKVRLYANKPARPVRTASTQSLTYRAASFQLHAPQPVRPSSLRVARTSSSRGESLSPSVHTGLCVSERYYTHAPPAALLSAAERARTPFAFIVKYATPESHSTVLANVAQLRSSVAFGRVGRA